jgi:hypothetical protein
MIYFLFRLSDVLGIRKWQPVKNVVHVVDFYVYIVVEKNSRIIVYDIIVKIVIKTV